MSAQAQAIAGGAEVLNKNKPVQMILWGLGGLALVGIFLVGKKVLENMQIIDDASERKMKRNVTTAESDGYTSSSYWKSLPEKKQAELKAKAKELTGLSTDINKAIWSWGGMNEDEEAVIGAVKKMQSKGEFSYTADIYYTATKKDMWSDIKNALYGYLDKSEADINQVTNHLKSLPK